MSTFFLKVSNRSAKKPIKKLPTGIEITDKTTVQDVKNNLAKRAGGWNPERFGLFDPEKKKILKDRKALVINHEEVMKGGEILVKDLGPQLSWTTVFIIEYIGPILIHLAFASPLVRKTIYRTSEATPLSPSQYLSMAMIVLHFLKREYETIYVHKFSLSTMPLFNIFKNSAHYWILSGINIAYFIYSPTSWTSLSSPTITYLNIVGLVLYIFGEVANFYAHQSLSSLRTRGGTERGIPKGFGFDLVTCPNYLFEIIACTGILLVTKSWTTSVFNIAAYAQMQHWAVKKERALRAEFPDKYKKKKYVLLPSPGAVIKYLTTVEKAT